LLREKADEFAREKAGDIAREEAKEAGSQAYKEAYPEAFADKLEQLLADVLRKPRFGGAFFTSGDRYPYTGPALNKNHPRIGEVGH
jgi:hypothetical protein